MERRQSNGRNLASNLFLIVFLIIIAAAAIHLRFLQTLTKVSAEKNSTMILPLPIDLLTAFLQKKEKE
ncbi:MAG: hypothetical protein MUP27_02555 [Desulfobacterales bacterium]|nr:hypothetical protein [Desulfobacterales bacterium]